MAVTPTRLCSTYLPGTVTALYTVPTGVVTRIDAMTLTNPGASALSVSVHLVAAGGSADNSNVVLSGYTLAPGETRRVTGAIGQVLRAGGTVQGVCATASVVNIYASGVEIA